MYVRWSKWCCCCYLLLLVRLLWPIIIISEHAIYALTMLVELKSDFFFDRCCLFLISSTDTFLSFRAKLVHS